MKIEVLATKGEYRLIKRTLDIHPNKKSDIDYCIEKRCKWDNMPDNLIRYCIIYFNRSKRKVEHRFLFGLEKYE
jgi:hypothetical protein